MRDVVIGWHRDREGLRGRIRLEAGVVEEDHAVVHVQTVRDKATVVQRHRDRLDGGGSREFDGKFRSVGFEDLGR